MATDTIFVFTMNRGIRQGAWSRYVFPFTVEHFAHLESTLYMRHENTVSFAVHDQVDDDGSPFSATIQWPWLDFGQPGVNKMMIGFDLVGDGECSIEFGYHQGSPGTFTASYDVPTDTFVGQMIPFPLNAPSLSVRLTYPGGQNWQWNYLSLYLQKMRPGS